MQIQVRKGEHNAKDHILHEFTQWETVKAL